MFILTATSEAVPFCKTGGLGDVCGSLPREVARLGHRAAVVLPAFRQVLASGQPFEVTGIKLALRIGRKTVKGEVFKSHLPDSDVPVYLIRQDEYFNRPELYRQEGADYYDNCERFTFFCRAVMELIPWLDARPDVLHCNDWTSGLIPAYLRTEYASRPDHRSIASLLTIHNLAYQGNFWHWDMELTGINWRHFNWREMEFYGKLSFLKSGIAFADKINTVSPRYAEEIQSPPLSCSLEGALRFRRDDLSGIINGVDYRVWDPATDEHLASDGYANYDVDAVANGKPRCKAALQKELGLPQQDDVPIIGIVGRLADQKGWDLIAPVIQEWVRTESAQWAILGTGEPKYHELLANLASQHPENVAVRLAFSNPLAHRIEAGADVFLMPSQFEPCGLNQLYSLRYGTVPVVRATGGLADTITNATEMTLADGTANGFSFTDYRAIALSKTLHRAVDTHRDGEAWQRLLTAGMKQDWSWAHSAKEYVALYETMVAAKRRVPVVH